MSCSKPVPPFNFDVLYYLNRNQLERFSIVCRPLKNFIDRYFNSKPYRVFDRLYIRGGSYALIHNDAQCHPNRDDYSIQQFLAGQKCNVYESRYFGESRTYYTFAEMRPYLGPTIRIKRASIYVGRDSTYNPEHVEQMESLAYLWRNGNISITVDICGQLVAEEFLLVLNSPTILQCRELYMHSAHFSFKDYKILCTVNKLEVVYYNERIEPDYWPQFVEQPGVKPVIVLHHLHRQSVDSLLGRICKSFSSAVSPNAFKFVFLHDGEPLTEFRETNKTSGEILELKEIECHDIMDFDDYYSLERSSI